MAIGVHRPPPIQRGTRLLVDVLRNWSFGRRENASVPGARTRDTEANRLESCGITPEVVDELRGPGERATGGHPDVIAWRGNRTVFVVYKSPSL